MQTSSRSRSVDTGPPDRRAEYRRVLFSSYLGTTIEFYDFLLYGTAAAVVFPAVFFSGLDEFTAVLFSLGTFAAGYVARPLGGVIFGHYGDRIGRKKMLVVTMLVMGVASFLIGLVPSAAMIGGWAAVILVLLRVAQGIAVGGEWGGASLMALEHSGGEGRGLAASFVNAGAPSGAVLGSLMLGLFSLLPQEQFLSWGWRIPFLLSAVLLGLGLWVRSQVSESPVFQAALAKAEEQERTKEPLPLLSVLRRPKALILTTRWARAPRSPSRSRWRRSRRPTRCSTAPPGPRCCSASRSRRSWRSSVCCWRAGCPTGSAGGPSSWSASSAGPRWPSRCSRCGGRATPC